jgi:hypothetical protein
MTITNGDLKDAMETAKASYLAFPIEDEKGLRIAGTIFRTLERAYLQSIKVKRTPKIKAAIA